jgi:hypothetical protein
MMAGTSDDREHSTLACAAALIALVLVLLGAVCYGVSSEVLQRQWHDLTGRPGGPMTFRFFLQPAMAAIAAAHDGIRDAQLGRSPYFWTVVNDPAKRAGRLREGWVSTARIMLLGIGMDAIYQLAVLKAFYPAEAILVAIALAFIPYVLLRGPIARIARWRLSVKSGGAAQ